MLDLKRCGFNLTEAFRATLEYSNLLVNKRKLITPSTGGDGRPVLVIPGLTASDRMTKHLCKILKEKGYKAYGWEGGYNRGLNDKTAEHLSQRLQQVFKENGNEKVTLIGHSLGGLFARELAREFPEMVHEVISMGTGFGVGLDQNALPAVVRKVINASSAISLEDEDLARRMLTPPPVPATSIFSKKDGVSSWRICLNPATPQTENIQVGSGHVGLIWNVDAINVILARLAQPKDQWKPLFMAGTEKLPKNPHWKPGKSAAANLFRKN